MALQYNTIFEITNNSMNWNLKVHIIRFWTVPNKYKPDIPYIMELILQDEKNTIVTESEDSSFYMDVFKLRTFEEVEIQHKIDENQLIGMVSFKFIRDFLHCTEESSYWIGVKIVCLELGHRWSYLTCNKCITKVDPLGDKYYCVKCNAEVISVIHRYRLQIHVTDETVYISLLLWNKEVLQLIGKTTKELTAGFIGGADMGYPIELDSLIEKRLMFKVHIKDSNINKNDNVYKVVKFIDDGDADMGYPIELDSLIEKRLMFKVHIKDSNINKNDNVYKVVKFIDDEALLKEYCHPSLIHNLNEATLDCGQSYDKDKLIETPIKIDCASSQNEDVIDLTRKLYPNSGKHVGVRPTHSNYEGLNVKLPSNKLCKVIKKEKKT
ncbi:hypothetical protein MTR67_035470 [Solanum verrucosum]|uniref:Replication factor A C-terminal domain-containing protein n=1 Tax=Solanum verrucosum TaxID=315347 RepID=A0AAF0U9U5_SOLVR|nr:hypothetical protein MTR67_035470 [Solanum verrucosum]